MSLYHRKSLFGSFGSPVSFNSSYNTNSQSAVSRVTHKGFHSVNNLSKNLNMNSVEIINFLKREGLMEKQGKRIATKYALDNNLAKECIATGGNTYYAWNYQYVKDKITQSTDEDIFKVLDRLFFDNNYTIEQKYLKVLNYINNLPHTIKSKYLHSMISLYDVQKVSSAILTKYQDRKASYVVDKILNNGVII